MYKAQPAVLPIGKPAAVVIPISDDCQRLLITMVNLELIGTLRLHC